MGKYINTNDLELEVSHYLQCEKESEAITLEELKEITNRLPSFEHYRSADMCDFYIDVKHGEWKEVTNGRGGHECSLCGNYAPDYQSGVENLSDFCPHCGADMRRKLND